MEKLRSVLARQGGAALAALHLALGLAASPGWLFSKYPRLVEGLEAGTLAPAQVADASPAYLVLAGLLSPEALRWLQLALASLAVAVLFGALRRAAGPVAAWTGAGLLALSEDWLVYASVLEPDLLIGVTLLLAGVSLAGGRGRRGRLVAAAAMGLAVALRPTALLLAAGVLAWQAWRRTPAGELGLAVAVAAAVAVLPGLALQLRLGHDPRGTMSAGQLFHQGHRPESAGPGGAFPTLLKVVEAEQASGPHPPDQAHQLYRELARASAGAPLSDAGTEAYWLGQALAWLAAAPGAALRQQLDKALFFLAPPEGESDVPEVLPVLADAPGVPLRALGLLGAGGLLVAAAAALGRRPAPGGPGRGPGPAAALAPWALQWVAGLGVAQLFFPQARYLVGLAPALAALAGLGAATLAGALEGARTRPARALALAALAAAPAGVLLAPRVRWADRMAERVAAADAAGRRPLGAGDRWVAARDRYLDAQAAMPDVFWPTSPRGAGLVGDEAEAAVQAAGRAAARWGQAEPVDATLAAGLWAAAGRCDQALPLAAAAAAAGFAWALGDAPIDPRLVAADCLVALGRRGEAVAALEAAEAAAPGRLEVLARLVAAGDTGAATDVARWEQELYALHDGPGAHLALARARRRWGDPSGAEADAAWVAGRWPRAAPLAQVERALALVAQGRGTEAARAWAAASGLHAPVHGLEALDGLASAAVAADPAAAPLALRHFALRGDRPRVRALLAAHPELAGTALAGDGRDGSWRF